MANAYNKDIFDYFKRSVRNIKYDVAQNVIHCKSPPTLESLAITKTAITLWQHVDIINNIIHSLCSDYTHLSFENLYKNLWSPCENAVLSRIFQLSLTRCCTAALEQNIKLISQQILTFLISTCHLVTTISDDMKKSILDQISWTYQGTIHNLKTSLCLIENTELSTIDKYIIACNNCIIDKIYSLHKQLPGNFINNQIYINKFKYRMVLFWTYHIRGKQADFLEIVSQDFSIDVVIRNYNNYIFQWAVKYGNEVSVQYIWEHLCDEEVRANLVHSVKHIKLWQLEYLKSKGSVIDVGSLNTLHYLMLQMTDNEIEEMCSDNIYDLLRNLLDDWRIYDAFFPTAKFVLQFVDAMEVQDALKILLWWKDSVFERNQKQFLFSKINVEDRLQYMYVEGLYHCIDLIKRENHYLIDMFLRGMLVNEEDICDYKKYFLQVKGFGLCGDYIYEENYKAADAFLKVFCTGDEINLFKYEFAYRDGGITTRLINNADKIRVLGWCFDGNEEEIDHYMIVFHTDDFFRFTM